MLPSDVAVGSKADIKQTATIGLPWANSGRRRGRT